MKPRTSGNMAIHRIKNSWDTLVGASWQYLRTRQISSKTLFTGVFVFFSTGVSDVQIQVLYNTPFREHSYHCDTFQLEYLYFRLSALASLPQKAEYILVYEDVGHVLLILKISRTPILVAE